VGLVVQRNAVDGTKRRHRHQTGASNRRRPAAGCGHCRSTRVAGLGRRLGQGPRPSFPRSRETTAASTSAEGTGLVPPSLLAWRTGAFRVVAELAPWHARGTSISSMGCGPHRPDAAGEHLSELRRENGRTGTDQPERERGFRVFPGWRGRRPPAGPEVLTFRVRSMAYRSFRRRRSWG